MSQSSSVLESTQTQSDSSTRTDYTYTVEKSRFGLYTSVLTDGTRMVCGPTEDAVRFVTDEIHIPVMKNEFTGFTSETRSGTVEGKL